MSRLLDRSDYDDGDFELRERVSFVYDGMRLYGEVARIHSTRTVYHVEVGRHRYLVHPEEDDMRRE